MAVNAVVHDTTFDIDLTGLDALWGLKQHLSIPLNQVVSARVLPRDEATQQLGLRLHGTWFPGRLHAGTFLIRERKGPFRSRPRAFVFMRRGSSVLEVQTTLDVPAVILVECADANDLAWFIGERLGR